MAELLYRAVNFKKNKTCAIKCKHHRHW